MNESKAKHYVNSQLQSKNEEIKILKRKITNLREELRNCTQLNGKYLSEIRALRQKDTAAKDMAKNWE